jgi:hypothetical protein
MSRRNLYSVLQLNNSLEYSKEVDISHIKIEDDFIPIFNNSLLNENKKKNQRIKTGLVLGKLTKLQDKISAHFEWNHPQNKKKDIFYLNRRIKIGEKPDINPINFIRYWKFLLFCDMAIEKFKKQENYQQSYCLNDLSEDDKKEFDKIAQSYHMNYNKNRLTITDLLLINEKTIDTKSEVKNFDEMSDEEIKELLKKRVEGLKVCSTNKKKTETLKRYYKEEYETEKKNLDMDLSLPEISDSINWDPNYFFSDFSEEKIIEIYDKIQDDQEKIKKLATFLPLELFDFTTEPKKSISLNKDKFITFMGNIKKENKNSQQLVLGFGRELRQDFFKTNQYTQLYSIMDFTEDSENNCSYFCEWNLFLNLLVTFMFTKSRTKIFPISFKLPHSNYSYNNNNNSYYFRKIINPYPSDILFDDMRDLIGIHLFKYTQNGENKIRCLFTFKNNEFGISQKKYYGFFSQFSGDQYKYFNTDFFLSKIELDELFAVTMVTHQEFYDIFKYYKLTPYIMGDNTKELFATRRQTDDPELQRLINSLDMKPVKIVKDKKDPKSPARFKIIPYLESETIDYEKGSFFDHTKIQLELTQKNSSRKFTQKKSSPNKSQFSKRKYSEPGKFKIQFRERPVKGGSKHKTRKNKKSKKTNHHK